jgi:hypothetical protein
MRMRHFSISIPSLEIALLRRGVGDRNASSERCRDCGRTPLVGEHIYRYDGGPVCCELCRAMRREQPVSSTLVHGPEHGHAVRLRIRAAA